ncbi:MAG TPA: hypothetical protein VKW06_00295 [Candidatus Angelobacter sp.]|nr:hypothetical protein [Candidatus Angelobacter sp.]
MSTPRKRGKHWQRKPAVIVFPDRREICNQSKAAGRGEYRFRLFLMWVRQYEPSLDYVRCCNCGLKLHLVDACFEHEHFRTKARRDDRIAIFDEDGRFVKHINGASHAHCNSARGSRRTEIWHGSNCVIEKEACIDG